MSVYSSKKPLFVLSALLVSSFLHLPALAVERDFFEEEYVAEAGFSAHSRSSRLLDLSLNTLRDAKGNRLQLLSKEEAAKLAPDLWSHLDLTDDRVPGTSTAKAYATLTLKKPDQPIIVAVLDSGVDIQHPDLAGMIWENEAEKNGLPEIDDDGNGYVDDVNGWNFIGGADGRNVGSTTLEVTRELKRMRKKNSGLLSVFRMTKKDRAYLADLEANYGEQKSEADEGLAEFSPLEKEYLAALEILKKAGLAEESVDAVTALVTKTPEENAAKETMLKQLEQGRDSSVLRSIVAYFSSILNYYLNLNHDSSEIIGDNPKNLKEKFYGNNDVRAIGAEHGTHCSGIIGALRNNGIGLDGQSNYLKIMPIRAVPDGDERDKDIANGIRYAVDHGAKVISMSFGKAYSPGKAAVDAAVEYAASKNVLLVHAAGNSAKDLEIGHNFPTAKLLNGKIASNWIEVGASTKYADDRLPAKFSNYGSKTVDLFAPGKDIYSTTPDGTYSVYSGTSMATPEVAGIAALVLSQKPSLSAPELKKILTSTVTPFGDLDVRLPMEGGGTPEIVPFSSLSATGGVVNALEALKAL